MASVTEKKRVIIQHPCVFTRESLKYILTYSSKASPATVVASVATLADCDQPLQRFPDTHLIILNLQSRDATADISLSHLVNHLREHHPRCRVIIIAEAFCVRLLRQYFYHVSQVCVVIARQAPLSEFITQINTAFFPRLYPKWRQPVRLTYQERIILTLLLRGRSNNAIADYLCLSNKTISYHKRSVMSKLGFLVPPEGVMSEDGPIVAHSPTQFFNHAIVHLSFVLAAMVCDKKSMDSMTDE